MSEQTTAGASPTPDAADATQGGSTTYVPQALLTIANARIAELKAERNALLEIERFARMAVDGDVDESAKGWMLLSDALAKREGGE